MASVAKLVPTAGGVAASSRPSALPHIAPIQSLSALSRLRLFWRYVRSGRRLYVTSNPQAANNTLFFANLVEPIGFYPFQAWKTVPPEHSQHSGVARSRELVNAIFYKPLPPYVFWNLDDDEKIRECLPRLYSPQSQDDFESAWEIYKQVLSRHRWFHLTEQDILDARYTYHRALLDDPAKV